MDGIFFFRFFRIPLTVAIFSYLFLVQTSSSSFTLPEASVRNKYNGETLVFWDDFNDELDLRNRWKPEISLSGFGNWEFQLYNNNRSSLFVSEGNLYIKPMMLPLTPTQIKDGYTLDIWGTDPPSQCTGPQYFGCIRSSGAGGNYLNPIQSGRLRTAETFNFRYGRVEISAKLPKGDWTWPALWLLPRHQFYGPWPSSGEIDIMESRGNDPSYPPGGHNAFGSTLHVGPYYSANMFPIFHKQYTHSSSLHDSFHIYGLKWTPLGIKTYIDDPSNVVLDVPFTDTMFQRGSGNKFFPSSVDNPWSSSSRPNAAPFDQEFYLIMNVAVGGTSAYFPDGYGKPWSNQEEHPLNSFYNNQNLWINTWRQSSSSSTTMNDPHPTAMVIDSVYVWQDSNGLDGSTASGKWLEYAAAYGGTTVLPPSFKQVKGNINAYRDLLPTIPGTGTGSNARQRRMEESTVPSQTETGPLSPPKDNNTLLAMIFKNLQNYLENYFVLTTTKNTNTTGLSPTNTSLYIEIGLKNNTAE